MKRKNLAVAGAVFSILLAAAFIFSACGELEVAEEVVLRPVITPYISVPPKSASYRVGGTFADLQAQIWDWDQEDGALSYQWYIFGNGAVSFADFAATGAGDPIDEVNGGSGELDPEDFEESSSLGMKVHTIPLNINSLISSPAAGDRYYFYLEITNTDPDTTDAVQYKTIRSEIASITFSGASESLYPLISKQPVSSDYLFGRNLVIAPLSVKATAPEGGTLSYQWYYDNTYSGSADPADHTPITLDPLILDHSVYTPTIDLLKPEANYFFVAVTNNDGTNTPVTLLSVPAVITMIPGQTPLEPVITAQPNDKLYLLPSVTIQPLSVAAEPLIDGGELRYQWYSHTTHRASGGTAISGATSATYTPTFSASTAGTYYYYVVVSNFNEHVKSSAKTASISSRAVRIAVATPVTTPDNNATLTIQDPRNPANRYQYIRGYGGMDTAWANFPEQLPQDMETMYNPDWGLGYNINRIMINPGNTNVNISIRDLVNSHRPHYYENVKIVNKYGGYNLASPWSPPKEWKTNNSINGGGKLILAYRQQYADYLRTFARHMYDAGAPIYAISISNEPNYTAGYDGCEWEPEDMQDFYKNVSPQPYTRGIRGYGGGKELDRVLILNGESANTPYINIETLKDPVSRANIDFLARHVYGEATKTLWRVYGGTYTTNPKVDNVLTFGGSVANNFAAVSNASPPTLLKKEDGTFFEVWMTEHNINSANATAYPNDSTWNYLWRFMNDVDLVMRMNNENAFVWWASKRFYSMIGDGQFGTRNGAVLPRGMGLSHYAKYTIDTHRVAINLTGAFADKTTPIGALEGAQSAVNNTTFNLDNTALRVTAYASIRSGKDNKPVTNFKLGEPDEIGFNSGEIEYLSLVMWAPTNTSGGAGKNLGTVRIDVPSGFLIGGVSAHKSKSAASMFVPEPVTVNAQRTRAFVTLAPGEILSVKLTREQ